MYGRVRSPCRRSVLDAVRRRSGYTLDARRGIRRPARLHTLVTSLRRDHAAVTAGLGLPYSSGAVEGQVNRIKALKRAMFGRANPDLIGQRILIPHRVRDLPTHS
jgi:transposase